LNYVKNKILGNSIFLQKEEIFLIDSNFFFDPMVEFMFMKYVRKVTESFLPVDSPAPSRKKSVLRVPYPDSIVAGNSTISASLPSKKKKRVTKSKKHKNTHVSKNRG
jgi:hypothetical protein